MRNIYKQKKGITLIALVITIIVLLILAGISISMLAGDNSILQRATDAKTNTEKAQIIENARTDILGQQVENNGTNITKVQLATILNKYFKPTETSVIPDEVSSESGHDLELTTIDEKYKINLSKIFKGSFKDGEEIISIPTDIFVALYNNGTLVFSNNERDIDNTKVTTNYGNIKNDIYDVSNPEPWCTSWPTINKVKIINRILPDNTSFWFSKLYNLTEIENIENIDTKNVTSMQCMFEMCTNLSSINLSNFNTSNVTNMSYMFASCVKLVVLDLSNFDTSKVTNMSGMFYVLDDDGYGILSTIIVGNKWNTNAVTNSSGMFGRCSSLVGEKGTVFNSSKIDIEYAHIDGGTSNPGYFCEKLTGDALVLFNEFKGKTIMEVASYDFNTNTLIFTNDAIEHVPSDSDFIIKYNNNYYSVIWNSNNIIAYVSNYEM